nr:ThiF family adenylyltransferase [Amylibacter sp.]
MALPVSLSLTGDQHAHLQNFLFPGDGKEAVAIILCSVRDGDRRVKLISKEIHGIPYEECDRTSRKVTWSPDYCVDIFERAALEKLTIVKVHSHPGGYSEFSDIDNVGDASLLPMISSWLEHSHPVGSVVMLPEGQLFGRVINQNGTFDPIECIAVAGNDLNFWYAAGADPEKSTFLASHAQAFGQGTTERLQKLSFAVVGASGTGSPTIEQLARLGAKRIVVVDDDKVEPRNVNRIWNSTVKDAERDRSKVDVIGDAIERIGLGTEIVRMPANLWNPDVIRSVAQCDVIFGCMDTIDGRFLLNLLSTYYSIPYFDIGVKLVAATGPSRAGGISEVCGTVNYIRPGRSSLISRGLFSMSEVAAAGLRRNDPGAHAQQVDDGYIAGAIEHRPAVISVNTFAASLAVSEFLARLHPFREEPNSEYSAVTFSLASMEFFNDPEEGICQIMQGDVGKGDTSPLLGLMELMEGARDD